MQPLIRRDTLLGRIKRDFPKAKAGDLTMVLGGQAIGVEAADALAELLVNPQAVSGGSADRARLTGAGQGARRRDAAGPRIAALHHIAAAAVEGVPIAVTVPVGQDAAAANRVVRALFDAGWEPQAILHSKPEASVAWVSYRGGVDGTPVLDSAIVNVLGQPLRPHRAAEIMRAAQGEIAARHPEVDQGVMRHILSQASERDAQRNIALLRPEPAVLVPTPELRKWAATFLDRFAAAKEVSAPDIHSQCHDLMADQPGQRGPG